MQLRLERRQAFGQGVGTFGLTFQLVGEPHKPIEEILPRSSARSSDRRVWSRRRTAVSAASRSTWSMRSTTASISLRRTR